MGSVYSGFHWFRTFTFTSGTVAGLRAEVRLFPVLKRSDDVVAGRVSRGMVVPGFLAVGEEPGSPPEFRALMLAAGVESPKTEPMYLSM